MFRRLLIIFSFCFLASCVPNKDLVYLQGDPVAKKSIYKLNNQPYRLQVDDILIIDVKAKEDKFVELFKKSNSTQTGGGSSFDGGNNSQVGYIVDIHGNIRIPIIGEVNVLGFTEKEVRIKLEDKLLKYLLDKENFFVTVSLSGIKYTVIGEIKEPGTKIINQKRVSVLEAISNSGGITVIGNRKRLKSGEIL